MGAAEKCQKAGFAFGLPLGVTTDTIQWIGALFLAYGADVMDKNGEITVKTDAVKQVLDYVKQRLADLQSAERLGRRQARRASSGREVLDARLPKGSEGAGQPDAAALPRGLEVL